MMRGPDITQESLFTTVQLETFVACDHPLRPIRELVNTALKRMSALFDTLYAEGGCESIPLERLVHALFLQEHFTMHGTLIQAWASQELSPQG